MMEFELVEVVKAMRMYEIRNHADPAHHCIAQQTIDLQRKVLEFQDLDGQPLIRAAELLSEEGYVQNRH